MAKCYKCLRGSRLNVRGVNPQTTLEMDIGGALLFVMPKENGKIEVHLIGANGLDARVKITDENVYTDCPKGVNHWRRSER